MDKNSKIYVAGHRGLVGNAILNELFKQGYKNLVFKTHKELDLTNKEAVFNFFKEERPEYVFLAAAKVGGIQANKTYPVEFLYQNLEIQNNVIMAAYKNKVKKLMFLGSSCIYPKLCPQPMQEKYLLSDYLEPTNEAYSIAKIAGLKLCEYLKKEYHANFISVMPTNIYGPNDNFDIESSHVIPSLIRRIHEAKEQNIDEVVIWGSGKIRREFMYVDDLAKALIFVMNNYSEEEFINIGTGIDIEINDLAILIKDIVGYKGKLINDPSKVDGTPQKLLDITKLKDMGWLYKTELEEGLRKTYKWFLENN